MASFSSLEIGKRALLAQRFGLDVTSNNIANINTPGYSRRTVVFKETDPRLTQAGFLGSGVIASRIDRVHEQFFDREVRNNISQNSGYGTDTQIIDRIEAAFNESSEFGLDKSIREFFQAFEDLSLRPESIDKRNIVLNTAQTMIGRFHATADSLRSLRDDTKNRLSSAVSSVNSLLGEIAEINKNVVLAYARSPDEQATLLDQRDVALEKLAKFANVQATVDNQGVANVAIGGNTLVTGTIAAVLDAKESIDPISGERTITLSQVDKNNNAVVAISPLSGELTSLLKHYNVTLDEADSSGGFSVMGELNSLADALVDRVNALSSTGFGLNDAGPAAPGRNFFTPATPTIPVTAANISLDAAVVGQPANIATAAAPGEPGNNVIARQIAAILTDQTFLNSSTPSEFYTSILSRVGTLGREAQGGATTTQLIGNQLVSQRDAINGVSLDEEAVNLIKYQKGFEASARIVNTTNEMLQLIINLGL